MTFSRIKMAISRYPPFSNKPKYLQLCPIFSSSIHGAASMSFARGRASPSLASWGNRLLIGKSEGPPFACRDRGLVGHPRSSGHVPLVCLQVTWGIFWHIVHSWFWDWTWRRNPWKETLDIFPNLAFRISFILQQDVTSGKIKRCRWFLDAAYLQNMNVVWNHHVNFLVDMRNIV